jgi:hypothetical protein
MILIYFINLAHLFFAIGVSLVAIGSLRSVSLRITEFV